MALEFLGKGKKKLRESREYGNQQVSLFEEKIGHAMGASRV